MITIVKGPDGIRTTFTTEEAVSQYDTLYISGEKRVKKGTSGYEAQVCGVAAESAESEKVVRGIIQGRVPSVICAEPVQPGDRVACALGTSGDVSGKAGLITPINTITPAGTMSLADGSAMSGDAGVGLVVSGSDVPLAWQGGAASGITGFVGTDFNTARVLGKALASGGVGSGIPILVSLGG